MGRRARGAVTVALLAVALTSCGSRSQTTTSSAFALAGCGMDVALVKVPAQRIRDRIPAPFRVGGYYDRDSAALAIWVLSCRRVGSGREASPGILALLGVQVASTSRLERKRPGPADFEHYLLAAQTNDARLAKAARRAGLPVSLQKGLRFSKGEVTTITVPGRQWGYTLAIRARKLDKRHDHNNLFWSRTPDVGDVALRLSLRAANDHYCERGDTGCRAVLTAPPRGGLARLLGRDALAPDLAFDHLPIRRGRLELSAPSGGGKPEGVTSPPDGRSHPRRQTRRKNVA